MKKKINTRSRRAWIKDLKEDEETASRKEAIGIPCDQEDKNGRNSVQSYISYVSGSSRLHFLYPRCH